MPYTVSLGKKHRNERIDIWVGRITGAEAGVTTTLPIGAKRVICAWLVATDGSPQTFIPNTSNTANFYATLSADETFDVVVWYERGNGATVTVGGVGTTTTTTTTNAAPTTTSPTTTTTGG